MQKVGLAGFTEQHRETLARTYARLFAETFPGEEPASDVSARIDQIASWTVGLFHLLASFLAERSDIRVFEYQKTLIQSGDLAALGVTDIVKACLLVQRAYQIAWTEAGMENPGEDWHERVHRIVELLLVSAGRFYEEKLKLNEKFIDQLFEGADLIFFLLDTGGRITRTNEMVSSLIGAPREQIIGRSIASYVHADDLPTMTRSIGLVLSGMPRIFELRVLAPGGQTRILHVFLSPLFETGHIVGMRLVAQDVSTQKALQEALRKSEQKFHALMDQAQGAIYLVDAEDGSLVDVNRRGAELAGLAAERVKGRTVLEIFTEDHAQKIIELIQEATHFGFARKSGVTLRGRPAAMLMSAVASTIRFGDTRLVQMALIEATADAEEAQSDTAHDIRSVIQEARRLREEYALVVTERTLNRMMRDAMREIYSYLHSAKTAGAASAPESGARATTELERSARLVELFEVVSRRRQSSDAIVDLSGCLEDLVAFCREAYGKRIVFHLSLERLTRIRDPKNLAMDAVINMVLASVLATKEGEISIVGSYQGNMNVIQVIDPGEDLPQELGSSSLDAVWFTSSLLRPMDCYRHAKSAAEENGGGLQIRRGQTGGAHVTFSWPGARWDDLTPESSYKMTVVPTSSNGENQ